MEDKELSQWFDINVQKPWELGVYEVELKGYTRDQDSAYSFWDGVKFSQPCIVGFKHVEGSKTWAVTAAHLIYAWRGLASNLSAKPKPKGNRKVTKWMVLDDNRTYGKRNIACFDTKKQANEFIEYRAKKDSSLKMRAEKIRFRTPEA